MSTLNDILTTDTGRQQRRRVGRGLGSGLGKTGGRGQKGEGSRTGGKNRGPMFEGGQFPFWMRLPKRGFTNFEHRVSYHAVDLARALQRVKGDITLESLVEAGLARPGALVKVLGGQAKVDRKLTIAVHKVSASVRAAIEAAGGKITEIAAASEPSA